MRFLIQRPYEDEMLTSAAMRSAQFASVPLSTLLYAVGCARTVVNFFAWQHLRVLAACLRVEPDLLLDRHTLFPFFTCLFDSDLVAAFRARILLKGANRAGGERNSHSGLAPRRWCPQCAVDDLRKLGESYWRVSHNIPGGLICLRHHSPLVMSDAPSRFDARDADIRMPHQMRGSVPVVTAASPYLLQLTKVVLRRWRSPGAEYAERGRDWMQHRFETLGFSMESRGRFNKELRALLVSCFGDAGPSVFTTDFEAELTRAVRVPSYAKDALWSPIKYLSVQAALELPAREFQRHFPTGLVWRSRTREGISAHDVALAEKARLFIDKRIEARQTTELSEVKKHCGIDGKFYADLRFPLLQTQFRRLRNSKVARRPLPARSDAECAEIARRFVQTHTSAGQLIFVSEMLRACGHKHNVRQSSYPLLHAEIEALRRSPLAAKPLGAKPDSVLAAKAKEFIDKRLIAGTRTSVGDVLRACGLERAVGSKRRPLLGAELERLKHLSIAIYRRRNAAQPERARNDTPS